MTSILDADNVAASYDGRSIFAGVTLHLAKGCHALRGANGIGKSTLLRVLAGAHATDRGTIRIDGMDLVRTPIEARRRLSFVPDESPVYPFMTGADLLNFVAHAKGADIGGITSLIQDFALEPQLGVRFNSLSLGTQKKVLLCAAAIGAPRLILMDEPSNGIDASARERLAALIRDWGVNSTVLFATHDAEFVAETGASVLEMADVLAHAGGQP